MKILSSINRLRNKSWYYIFWLEEKEFMFQRLYNKYFYINMTDFISIATTSQIVLIVFLDTNIIMTSFWLNIHYVLNS